MCRVVRTGRVIPSSPWNKQPGHLDTRRGRVLHLKVSRVVVIALQQPFVVGTRPDDRNALDGGSKRQHPVVGQQDGRRCNSLAS